MKNIEEITGIIESVKNGNVTSTSTNVVPNLRDMFSARIIFNHFSSKEDFKKKFNNTFLWLENLQKKENWRSILQDFLFLVKECI